MPYSIHVERDRNRVVTTWCGEVTDEELLSCQSDLLALPDVEGFGQISDFSDATSLAVSSKGVQTVTQTGARHDGERPVRMALVVKSELEMGFARMYEARRELEETSTRIVRIFRSMDEASAWLDSDVSPG